VISLYLVSVGEGLLAQVAVGGRSLYPPGYFFIVAGIKIGLLYSPGRGVNSWGWLSRLTLEATGIAIL
jgi:hypothetical protein